MNYSVLNNVTLCLLMSYQMTPELLAKLNVSIMNQH